MVVLACGYGGAVGSWIFFSFLGESLTLTVSIVALYQFLPGQLLLWTQALQQRN